MAFYIRTTIETAASAESRGEWNGAMRALIRRLFHMSGQLLTKVLSRNAFSCEGISK